MNNRYIIFKHKQKLLLVLKSSLLVLILAYWYLQSVSELYALGKIINMAKIEILYSYNKTILDETKFG